MTRALARAVAGSLLGALAVLELVHDVGGARWPGLALQPLVIAALLVPVLSAGALAGFSQRPGSGSLVIGAGVVAATHGGFASLAARGLPDLFVVGGLLAVLLVALSTPIARVPGSLLRRRLARVR